MLEKIKADFSSEYKSNSDIKSILEKVSKGTANLIDVEKYSRTLGNILSQSLKKFVTPDSLPDERFYYNIAQTIFEPMLKDNYEFVNDLASQVQKSIDSKAKIQLNPQKAIYPIERINQVINAVSDVKAEWETIQRRLDSPVCTVTESFYDDYVKENAKFRNDSGLNCYITRTASANCCKWCSSLAGRYAYSDAPPDVYRRHDNCTCTVTFENGKTRQDVWSKKTWEAKETPKESYKPKKFSNEQAKAVQQENLKYKGIQNNLTSFQNNGNIEIERAISFKKVDKAIEYAKNKLSISADALSVLPVEKVNVILKHISRLYAKMPVLDGFVGEIILEKMSEIAKASVKWIDGKPLVRLKLSSSIFSNMSIDEIESFINDAVKNKDFSPKEGLYGIFKHEFAHMAEYLYTLKRYGNLQEGVSKSLDNFEFAREIKELALKNCNLEDNESVIKNYIGKYAIENPAEFVAEAYSSTADNKLINETKRILKRKWGI